MATPVLSSVARSGAARVLARAALVAALAVMLLTAGCAGTKQGSGTAAAADGPPGGDKVRLVVSRDFGAEILRDVTVPWRDDLDVLRLLAENAEVDTGYGGGFVKGLDGLESNFGGASTADAADWFYWVDGVLGDVGAADWKLRSGETVWWDYHRWADAIVVPMALHAFPRPYSGPPLTVTAARGVTGLKRWAADVGLDLERRRGPADEPPDGGLVLATVAEAAAVSWIGDLLGSARSSLELVTLGDAGLTLLSPAGASGPEASAVALPISNPDDPGRPFLLVLGATYADLEEFVPRLTPEALDAAVAVALVDDELVRLPWQDR